MDEDETEDMTAPTLHSLKTLERSWTEGSNDSVQQWVDNLSQTDLLDIIEERPRSPPETSAYGDVHFLPIPGTGDDDLTLGAEAKSMRLSGSDSWYSISPRLSPLNFDVTDLAFPLFHGSWDADFEIIDERKNDEKKQKVNRTVVENVQEVKWLPQEETNDVRNSVTKHDSVSSFHSVSSLLAAMENDPEDMLRSLGFDNQFSSSFHRIPMRFLMNSSQAKGINVEKFCAQVSGEGREESSCTSEDEVRTRLPSRFSQSSIDLSLVDQDESIFAQIRRAKFSQISVPSITINEDDTEVTNSENNSAPRGLGYLRLSTVVEESEYGSRRSSLSKSFSNERRPCLQKQKQVEDDSNDLSLTHSVFNSIDKEDIDVKNIDYIVVEEEENRSTDDGKYSNEVKKEIRQDRETNDFGFLCKERKFENGFRKKTESLFPKIPFNSNGFDDDASVLTLHIPDSNNNGIGSIGSKLEIDRLKINSFKESDTYIAKGILSTEQSVPCIITEGNNEKADTNSFDINNDVTSRIDNEICDVLKSNNFELKDTDSEADDIFTDSESSCSIPDSIDHDFDSLDGTNENNSERNSNAFLVKIFSEDSLETDKSSFMNNDLSNENVEEDNSIFQDATRPPSRIVYRTLGQIENLKNGVENEVCSYDESPTKGCFEKKMFPGISHLFMGKSEKQHSRMVEVSTVEESNSDKCQSRKTSLETQNFVPDGYSAPPKRSSSRIKEYFYKLANGNNNSRLQNERSLSKKMVNSKEDFLWTNSNEDLTGRRTKGDEKGSFHKNNALMNGTDGFSDKWKTQSLNDLHQLSQRDKDGKSKLNGFDKLIRMLKIEGSSQKRKFEDVNLDNGEISHCEQNDEILHETLPSIDAIESRLRNSNVDDEKENLCRDQLKPFSHSLTWNEEETEINGKENGPQTLESKYPYVDPAECYAKGQFKRKNMHAGYSVESSGFEDETDLSKSVPERGLKVEENVTQQLCLNCIKKRRVEGTILEDSMSSTSGISHEERELLPVQNGIDSLVCNVTGLLEKDTLHSNDMVASNWMNLHQYDHLIGQVTALRRELTEQEERIKLYIDTSMERIRTSILTEISILNASFKTGSPEASFVEHH